jgi:F0F1-type ATP synthase epsilon subunit
MENTFNLKKFLAEGKLTENEYKETVNEGVLNFTPEEIEILKDGLGWILEYQEGVASDEYIAAVKELEAKLG